MNYKLFQVSLILFTLALLVTACATTATPVPTAPSTSPPVLTPTAIPPTFTPIPPTATSVPPTFTPVPSTPTPIPPTSTPPPNPRARGIFSMAYDSESGRVILFGGELGELFGPSGSSIWSYDPMTHQWAQMSPSQQVSGRNGHDMAYDIESDRITMFGGVGANFDGEATTWAYDFNTDSWLKQSPGPTARQGGRMAYDAESDRVILFGGEVAQQNGGGNLLNDTWAYDFNTDSWTAMNPNVSPPTQFYPTMTYDSESDRVLMWRGGSDNNMWAYDFNTNTWTDHETIEHPREGTFGWMVYDSESDRSILYGGGSPWGGDATSDATWAYDYNANTWTKMEPGESPNEMSLHAMAYSTDLDLVVLFGGKVGSGSAYTDKTWTYDLNSDTWENVMLGQE